MPLRLLPFTVRVPVPSNVSWLLLCRAAFLELPAPSLRKFSLPLARMTVTALSTSTSMAGPSLLVMDTPSRESVSRLSGVMVSEPSVVLPDR